MEKTSDKYQLFWDWFDKFEEYIFLNLETKTDENDDEYESYNIVKLQLIEEE